MNLFFGPQESRNRYDLRGDQTDSVGQLETLSRGELVSRNGVGLSELDGCLSGELLTGMSGARLSERSRSFRLRRMRLISPSNPCDCQKR